MRKICMQKSLLLPISNKFYMTFKKYFTTLFLFAFLNLFFLGCSVSSIEQIDSKIVTQSDSIFESICSMDETEHPKKKRFKNAKRNKVVKYFLKVI